MNEPRLGVKTDEIGVYHYVDDNGKMYCTRYRPETLKIVEPADTFGMDLCEDCDKRKTDKDIAESTLEGVE